MAERKAPVRRRRLGRMDDVSAKTHLRQLREGFTYDDRGRGGREQLAHPADRLAGAAATRGRQRGRACEAATGPPRSGGAARGPRDRLGRHLGDLALPKALDRLDRYQTVASANQAYDDEARKKLLDKINRLAEDLGINKDFEAAVQAHLKKTGQIPAMNRARPRAGGGF